MTKYKKEKPIVLLISYLQIFTSLDLLDPCLELVCSIALGEHVCQIEKILDFTNLNNFLILQLLHPVLSIIESSSDPRNWTGIRRWVPFGGTRIHDPAILRSKFCQLRHCRSLIYNGGRMIQAIITPDVQTTRPVCRPSQTGLVAQTGLGQQTGLSPRIWCTKQVFLQRSPCKICRPACKKMQNIQTGL